MTTILIYLHIAGGTAALISGAISGISEKGKKPHIRSGRIFGLTMAVTAISAIFLSLIRPNPFLLGIGFFTIYLTASGWIWIRRIPLALRVKYARLIAFGGMITAAFMLFEAFSSHTMNVVLLVFSLILLVMAVPDALRRKNPKSAATLHAARMGGAYIAAFTAFLVVNVNLGIWGWLLPSAVGSPLIAFGVRRYLNSLKRPSTQ